MREEQPQQETPVFPLPDAMRQKIISHARRESPRECCGIIAGTGGAPARLFQLTNIAEGNTFYEIDPCQLIDLEFTILPQDGTEIVAIYHSHPVSEAYPSRTDVELAFWPEAVYLICSLEHPDAPVVRGFRIQNESIIEVDLRP